MVVGLAVGIFALIQFHPSASASDDQESAGTNLPTVVSVQVGTLKRITLHRYLNGYGTVETAPATATESAAGAPLAAPGPGIVAKVNVVEGQHVEQGQVLMELNSSTATAVNAGQEVERQKKLYAQHNTSLKSLQDAEAQLALLQVVTPLSGTVTRLNVKPGAAADVSTVVAEVMDLSRLAISTGVPASDAGELEVGEEVQVSGTGFQPVGGEEPHPITTSLSFIGSAVDANTGTITARALLPTDSGLRPGQFVQLRIVTAAHTNCLAAPDESVITDQDGKNTVSLVKNDETTQLPVRTGFRDSGWTEVEGADLKEGDTVVTVGAYALPEKTKIQVANTNDQITAADAGQK
jgi:RND family efflux transporter MFP subunit